MAERRMFAKTIVLSDAFLDMPLSARCLYFTLGMLADDDGFVNSPKSIIRQCGASDDDLRVLLAKKFVIAFENGVVVIKHWRINNYLRNDRYKPTVYVDEKNTITVDDNGIYHTDSGIPSIGIPNMGIHRLGKDSIGKDSIDKVSKGGVGENPTPTTRKKNHVEFNLRLLEEFKCNNPDFKSIYPVLVEWLTYKGENKFSYQPQGFKALVTKILDSIYEYGIDAVSEVIRASMASGYKGIIFDKLKDTNRNSGKNENVFLKMLHEGGTDDQTGNDQNSCSAESGIPTVLPWA